jgi:hypothetical protein
MSPDAAAAATYPRFLRDRVVQALADTPVVLLHGPRQCGNATLAHQVCEPLGYGYLSFDDDGSATNASTLAQKLWNCCNDPTRGRSLAGSPCATTG